MDGPKLSGNNFPSSSGTDDSKGKKPRHDQEKGSYWNYEVELVGNNIEQYIDQQLKRLNDSGHSPTNPDKIYLAKRTVKALNKNLPEVAQMRVVVGPSSNTNHNTPTVNNYLPLTVLTINNIHSTTRRSGPAP